jgi:hypothetical protein
MNNNKNSIPYSASDIEKYRKGELSAGEMHDLEQAALDDPFLADAIEGLTQHPVTQQDLTDLQDRLKKRVAENTRRAAIPLIRRRITFAAALILLAGIGFTFFYHYSNQPQRALQPAPSAAVAANNRSGAESKAAADKADSTQLALTQPRTSHTTPTRSHRPANIPAASIPAANLASAPVASVAPPPVGHYYLPAPVPDTQNLKTGLAKQLAAARTEGDDKLLRIEKDSQTVPAPDRRLSSAQFLNFRPAEPLVYIGKVLDINSRPLAGASLTLKGNPASGAITDNEGLFKLNLRPADTTSQLTVSLVGYNQTSLTLNDLSYQARSSNVIYLRPANASFDEVVVTGYGAKRKALEAAAPSLSNERLDTSWNSAGPVIGRQAYLQYLQVTKGKLGLDSTVTGTETVSFIVSRDGSLSSFKIEQSLSPAHDAGILRLVTDGPAWRLISGKKVRAAVTVNF